MPDFECEDPSKSVKFALELAEDWSIYLITKMVLSLAYAILHRTVTLSIWKTSVLNSGYINELEIIAN